MHKQQQYAQHRLDFAVIKHISTQLNICSTFIDLLNWKHYQGRRYVEHGRIIIPLTQSSCIVIDKDHTTRYYVQEVLRKSLAGKKQAWYQGILCFRGYKFEKNKYMIHGEFQLFEMKTYWAYFGFEQIGWNEDLQQLDVQRRDGKADVLFCQINTPEECIKYYFDRQLQPIKLIRGVCRDRTVSKEYFSCDMLEGSLNKLYNHEFVSTNFLNYFFDRLMYSYYSQLWFKDTSPRRIKVFQSQSIVSFFFNTQPNFSYFNSALLNLYGKMRKSAFSEQELLILPIYEYGKDHFVLGAILNGKHNTQLFQLDPLDCPFGTWRNRLYLLIEEHHRLLQEKGIEYKKAEMHFKKRIECIGAPKQGISVDCGIYVCLYALLIMQRHGFCCLTEQLKQMCQGEEVGKLIHFLRRFLYYSYKERNLYLLPTLTQKDKFSQAFESYS